MQIFEYPYIIISICIVFFVLLVAIGVYFAVKGAKTAEGSDAWDFVAISKIENNYKKSAKQRVNRAVLYINFLFENLNNRGLEQIVFSDIKKVLINELCDPDSSSTSLYGEKNFVAFTKLTDEEIDDKLISLQNELNKCFVKRGVLNIVNVTVGLYSSIGTNISFNDAIGRAKQAGVLAKQNKTFSARWDAISGKALEKKIKIENNIEKEIDNNRFFLEYQPVLDAKTKKIIGAEVLSRLNSETDGVLTPGSFLSAVDSVGINEKFDYYIFEKNCKWISNDKKQREGYKYTINFSRTTLSEPSFSDKIISIAEKYDLKLSCLAVEVLEDKNINPEARKNMMENLSLLKQKGVSILLDDFGSGYTTFGDLQNLDISIVKIDKSITQNATTETGFIILKNIINTSRDIGFKTLCEGIETKEQEEAAINAGCDLLQGFYYYRPMPVAMLEKVLNAYEG